MLLAQIFFAIISTYHQVVRNSDYIRPAIKKMQEIKLAKKLDKQGMLTEQIKLMQQQLKKI